ncbi:MAG: (2Fe-2S)-binding protein [Pseudobacteriovorax sp.]|nr:(2Fe-2S)-binding protein [Pseudobacteriovorax sp.]
MIFCSCLGVSDKDVLELHKSGYPGKTIIQLTGASTKCGSCRQFLKHLLSDSGTQGSQS